MAKRTLTDTFIKALRPAPAGKREHHWDLQVHRFGVRVTDRGTKSFVLYTRVPPGRVPARLWLGDANDLNLAAARKKARDWLDIIAQGRDPREDARQALLAEQRARRITFGAVFEAWLQDVVRGKQRQARAVENEVRRGLLPHWGNRPISEIGARDVRDVIGKVKVHAPASAHNLLGHAKRLFAWAVEQDYGLIESPATSLRPKKLIGAKVARNRVLDDTELRAMWRAAGTLGYPYGPIFKLLALTGQRKSEVARARWREIDLDKKVWLIPAERMKGGAAHLVPLVDDALAILAELPEFGKGDHLFSTTFGSKAVGGFGRAKKRLDAAMAADLGRPVDPYVVHDIRRSVRTNLSALPITDKVRELVIAHAQPGLHKIYDLHSYRDEKHQALELWAARLRKIVSLPPTAEVVAYPARGLKGSPT